MLKRAWTAVAALAVMLGAASPAAADIKINEFDSDAPGGASDWVELYNTGPAPVDIGGYLFKDWGENNTVTIPAGTMLGAGAFFATDVTGLGDGDTVRLFDGATLLDSDTYPGHPGVTWGRCPDGTGEFVDTAASTRGAANFCPPPVPETWPGGTDVSVLDAVDAFPGNLSGLAYQPSGTRAKGLVWGVRNDPATLYKIIPSGARGRSAPALACATPTVAATRTPRASRAPTVTPTASTCRSSATAAARSPASCAMT
jgi:Lamin Tail Domain